MNKISVVIIPLLTSSCVIALATSGCIGKYYIESREGNFKIESRKVRSIEYENIDKQPRGSQIKNTGETIFFRIFFEQNEIPTLAGGPFGDEKYKFFSMYFHWLPDNVFFMELHMVFIKDKYTMLQEAEKEKYGILIIAFTYEVDNNAYTLDYFDFLKKLQNPENVILLDGADVPTIFNVTYVTEQYIFYIGKSTFPHGTACTADVIWMEYDYIASITPEQANLITNLKSFNNTPLMKRTMTTKSPTTPIYKSTDIIGHEKKGFAIRSFVSFEMESASGKLRPLNVVGTGVILCIVKILIA